MRSSTSSTPTDRRTRRVGDSQGSPLFRRDGSVRHDGRMLDEALHTAQAFRQGEDAAALEKPPGFGKAAAENRGDHATETAVIWRAASGAEGATAAPDRSPVPQRGAVPATRRFAGHWRNGVPSGGSVFRPRSARKESNGPAIAPTAFCRNASRSPRSRSSPTTATPPITSECPFRYFVAECTTISKLWSSGRWRYGVAKVLSATARMPRSRARRRSPQDRRLEHRIARRLHPDHARIRANGVGQFGRIRQICKRHFQPRRALADPLEKPERPPV